MFATCTQTVIEDNLEFSNEQHVVNMPVDLLVLVFKLLKKITFLKLYAKLYSFWYIKKSFSMFCI